MWEVLTAVARTTFITSPDRLAVRLGAATREGFAFALSGIGGRVLSIFSPPRGRRAQGTRAEFGPV